MGATSEPASGAPEPDPVAGRARADPPRLPALAASSRWPRARWWPTSTTPNPCSTPWRSTFRTGPGLASLIITATQVGYAAGLLLIVPLGDLYVRRVLVVRIFAVAAVALVACALAPDIWIFGLASVAVGGRLGGRPGHDPLRRRPGPGRTSGPRGGPDHDRPPPGHPARPHRIGPGGAGGRVAGDLLALRRAHGRLRRRAVARPSHREPAARTALRRPGRLLAAAPGGRARPAPAGMARGVCLRRFQRAVDDARLPALGRPLPLLQCRDRPLRPRGRGGNPGRQPGRQAGGRRSLHRLHPGGRRALDRRIRHACGPGARRWSP